MPQTSPLLQTPFLTGSGYTPPSAEGDTLILTKKAVGIETMRNLSSIVVNQSQVAETALFASGIAEGYIQEFHLPSDYRRGTESGELRYPRLSGLQLLVTIANGYEQYAAYDYALQYKVFGLDWITTTTGVAIGAPASGLTWMTAYFDEAVEITSTTATARWRIIFGGARPQGDTNDPRGVQVPYSNGEANALGIRVVVNLVPGEPYHFVHNGKKSFLYLDPNDGLAYFSVEQGLTKFMFTSPNPLALPYFDKAYNEHGGALTGTNGDAAFCFRILALTADDGVDFLGNQYRSVVVNNSANFISTALGADPDAYWLSKPNPSKFAVENLYFDMRKAWDRISDDDEPETVIDESAVVVDRMIVDPITPGVYFNIYYSNEGNPGTNEAQWENKLWTRVPKTYRAERRETHVFPEPVRAKYIKIEFSHLQARHYAPGNFQQPIRYKKHPKWVLDYFLARVATDQSNPFLAERVAVIYDAIDLAYNYYLDDLGQEPSTTIDVNNTVREQVVNFLSDRSDVSDRIDLTTLDKIDLTLNSFRQHPALRGNPNTLLADYARQTVDYTASYPTELRAPAAIANSDVSSLNRDRVVMEQNHPVMFFFLTCRHGYREVEATLTHDRAYFVGVRQLSFLRDNYMTAFDTATYIETASDTENVERNEFV